MSEQQEHVEVMPKRRLGDITSGGPVIAMIPRTIDDVFRVAKAIYMAHLAPDSYTEKKKDDPYPEDEAIARIVIGIMKGLEVGYPPITAINTIAIINNRPCIFGDGAQGLIQDRGHLEKTVVTELGLAPDKPEVGAFSDDYGFRVEMWRHGQSVPYVGEFTVRDAKRAKLWLNANKKPWLEHPKRMIFIRARAYAQRDGFADDLMGLSIAEEIRDITPSAPPQVNTDFLEDAPQRAIEHAPGVGQDSRTETSEASGEPEHSASGSPPLPLTSEQ